MVMYQLPTGLEDMQAQADLLAQSDITLDKVEKYATKKEIAKHSQENMLTEDMGRLCSSYKQQKIEPSSKTKKLCGNCGEEWHVGGREAECKAY